MTHVIAVMLECLKKTDSPKISECISQGLPLLVAVQSDVLLSVGFKFHTKFILLICHFLIF